MKTNYFGHDRIFAANKQRGYPGWCPSLEEYQSWQTAVAACLDGGLAPRSGRLLELGCGAGNMTRWFLDRGFDACGIDISPTAIAWARESMAAEATAPRFDIGNVVDLHAYEDDSFDFVFDGHCLHCIIGDDRASMLANVRRILRPGGYFLVDTMCKPVDPSTLGAERAAHFDPETGFVVYDGAAVRYIGEAEDILGELDLAGLQILSHKIRSPGKADPVGTLVVEALNPD